MAAKQRRPTLFIADPWHTLEHGTETTLLLIRAAQERGLTCLWTEPTQVYVRGNRLMAECRTVNRGATGLEGDNISIEVSRCHSVHWRTDPPVTFSTMRLWSLLAATVPSRLLVNSAESLLTWNEKYGALRYPKWSLTTSVAEDSLIQEASLRNIYGQGQLPLVKPAGDAASRGVLLLPANPEAGLGRFQGIRASLGPWPIVQEFDSKVREGETRVFILDGAVAGCLKKVPAQQAPVMQWDDPKLKPTIAIAKPSPTQRLRATRIAKDLKKDGVLFATIDFIGARLLEINVTSPGLVFFLGKNGESSKEVKAFTARYWNAVERSLAKRQ